MDGLKKGLATSYTGSFGYHAELAKGIVMAGHLIPIKMVGQPPHSMMYLSATDDQSIILQLLSARNFKKVKVFAIEEDESNFMGDLFRLGNAAVPFKTSIGISRWSYGKRTAAYVLREPNAKLVLDPSPHFIQNGSDKTWVFQMELPAAQIVEGAGGFSNMKKIK